MSEAGGSHKKRHLPEMDGETEETVLKKEHIKITKRELLKRYLKETEAVKKWNSTVTYIPSYRAVLAKHGILVRNDLGSGSYSKVKRAYSVSEYASVVAVKIVDKRIAAKDFLEKFLPREMRFWPVIRHPNIIHLHKLFQDDFRVYMILEYAQGGDLLKLVFHFYNVTLVGELGSRFQLLSFRQYMTERYSGQLQVLKMWQIFVILSYDSTRSHFVHI